VNPDLIDAPGFPGYRVSSDGRVWSVQMGDWKPLKPWIGTGGYLYLYLWIDGQRCICKVHSLICEAFHGPCPDGMLCRHPPESVEGRTGGSIMSAALTADDATETVNDVRARGGEKPIAGGNVSPAEWIARQIGEVRDLFEEPKPTPAAPSPRSAPKRKAASLFEE
jgi:hypothetical protein